VNNDRLQTVQHINWTAKPAGSLQPRGRAVRWLQCTSVTHGWAWLRDSCHSPSFNHIRTMHQNQYYHKWCSEQMCQHV